MMQKMCVWEEDSSSSALPPRSVGKGVIAEKKQKNIGNCKLCEGTFLMTLIYENWCCTGILFLVSNTTLYDCLFI